MSRRRDCPPTRKGRYHRCAIVPCCSCSRLGLSRPCLASIPTGRRPVHSRHGPATNRGGRRRRGLPFSTPGDRSGTRNPAQTCTTPPVQQPRAGASTRARHVLHDGRSPPRARLGHNTPRRRAARTPQCRPPPSPSCCQQTIPFTVRLARPPTLGARFDTCAQSRQGKLRRDSRRHGRRGSAISMHRAKVGHFGQ